MPVIPERPAHPPRRRTIALTLGVLMIAGAACGGGPTDDRAEKVRRTTTAPSTTTTVPPPIGRVTTVPLVDGEVPTGVVKGGIISLSPTATETLFAIGAGPQVVAVDSMSNYPLEAPITELSAAEPDLEAIAAYEPQLVITDGTNPDLVDQLNSLGIAALAAPVPRSLNGAFEQIETLGATTGNIAKAAALVIELEAEVAGILDAFPDREGRLTYYLELDPEYGSASSDTFIGAVLELLDLENIADPLDTNRSEGYPRLTADFVIEADPDLILLADTRCCGQSPDTVAARPGWDEIRAVQEGHVIALDDDVARRWGARTVELLRQVAEAIADVSPRARETSDGG